MSQSRCRSRSYHPFSPSLPCSGGQRDGNVVRIWEGNIDNGRAVPGSLPGIIQLSVEVAKAGCWGLRICLRAQPWPLLSTLLRTSSSGDALLARETGRSQTMLCSLCSFCRLHCAGEECSTEICLNAALGTLLLLPGVTTLDLAPIAVDSTTGPVRAGGCERVCVCAGVCVRGG